MFCAGKPLFTYSEYRRKNRTSMDSATGKGAMLMPDNKVGDISDRDKEIRELFEFMDFRIPNGLF